MRFRRKNRVFRVSEQNRRIKGAGPQRPCAGGIVAAGRPPGTGRGFCFAGVRGKKPRTAVRGPVCRKTSICVCRGRRPRRPVVRCQTKNSVVRLPFSGEACLAPTDRGTVFRRDWPFRTIRGKKPRTAVRGLLLYEGRTKLAKSERVPRGGAGGGRRACRYLHLLFFLLTAS